jgi:mono/diheme cytochrome c family protein
VRGRRCLCLATALTALVVAGGVRADDDRARVNYLLHCGGCHLPDGRGVPPEVPSLRAGLGRLTALPDGRRYLARVPGASQAPLSDAELTAVLNWILLTFSADTLPEDFTPLVADEVASARADVLADPLRERERLWSRYQSDPADGALIRPR